jgi:RecJ-like exonuclease
MKSCPVCHGTGYTVIHVDTRQRKNPSQGGERELRLPCTTCNGTGSVDD